MSRPRRARAKVHGWIILDKPPGITSTHALAQVKRVLNAEKAGHAGTLDPLASGILPLALGEATKTVPFVMEGSKAYRFTVRWGAETDTDDSEGAVTATSDARPDRAAIAALLPGFIGAVTQVPPRFSALKVDGERAYDRARDGEDFTLEARTVVIDRLDLVAAEPDEATFEATCGKGTYVRAIARDLGRMLGCLGHVRALRRTRVGPFDESSAVTLDAFLALGDKGPEAAALAAPILPVEAALGDLPAVPVSQADAQRLRNGQPVLLRGRDAPILAGPGYAMAQGRLVALVESEEGQLVPRRTFHL